MIQGEGGGGGGYWDPTGGYMLTYALPLRKIYLTGRDAEPKSWLSDEDIKEALEAGRFDARSGSVDALLKALGSWSAAVRTEAATELATRSDDVVPQLIALAEGGDTNAVLGACTALGALKARGAPGVPALARLLSSGNTWVRLGAADGLAGIGEPARTTIPAMLKACARVDPDDPRELLQRGLAFALFYPGGALGGPGLLGKSIEGVDRDLLYPAVRQIVRNNDGRARGCMRSVYGFLTREDVKALAPDILRSIQEKSPSGVMFAGGVRLAGVELLARYKIKEGIPLSYTAMDWKNWGAPHRISICLKALKEYGPAALPLLRKMEEEWTAGGKIDKNLRKSVEELRAVIAEVEQIQAQPELIGIEEL